MDDEQRQEGEGDGDDYAGSAEAVRNESRDCEYNGALEQVPRNGHEWLEVTKGQVANCEEKSHK